MKITRLIGLVLGMTVAAGPVASAQQITMEDGTRVAVLDSQVAGLNLQINGSVVRVGFQAKDDLFAGSEKFAQGASEVTEINLDPSTMGLVGSHGRDADEARKMKSMVIHTYKYDKPGMYRMEDLEAYRKKLEDGTWNCAIHVRNAAGATDICSRTAGDNETNEMVILTAEPQKLTFIHLRGKMSLSELNDMSGSATHFRPNTNLPREPMAPMPPMPPKSKEPKAKTVPPAAPASPAPQATPNL